MADSLNSYIVVNKTGNQLSFNLSLSLKVEKEGDLFVVECVELELVDYGETLKAAVSNLDKMIILTLTEAFHAGTLSKMLINLGFKNDAPYLHYTEIYKIPGEKFNNYYPLEKVNLSTPLYAGV
ncbi:MAG: hypothetical protein NTY09_07655 [bacterium]|nr:hypothetical protein [bacterium]